MSFVENQYNVNFNKKRSVYGAELDFYYKLFKINNIDVSLYGEFAGIWFPESVYYVLYDNANNVLHFDSDSLNTFQVNTSDFSPEYFGFFNVYTNLIV